MAQIWTSHSKLLESFRWHIYSLFSMLTAYNIPYCAIVIYAAASMYARMFSRWNLLATAYLHSHKYCPHRLNVKNSTAVVQVKRISLLCKCGYTSHAQSNDKSTMYHTFLQHLFTYIHIYFKENTLAFCWFSGNLNVCVWHIYAIDLIYCVPYWLT